MREIGVPPRTIVFEDEVTPDMVRKVYDHFRAATGVEPTMLFPGAGGYWWRLIHRDTVAAAFKRSATGERPNVKFSNTPGKESLGGYLRVYGRGDALVIADASEPAQGEPLFVKLVEAGRIVYRESFQEQAARADRTWGRYKRVELSPLMAEYRGRFNAMREREVAEAKARRMLNCRQLHLDGGHDKICSVSHSRAAQIEEDPLMPVPIAATLNEIAGWPVEDQIDLLHQAWDHLLDSGWQPQ